MAQVTWNKMVLTAQKQEPVSVTVFPITWCNPFNLFLCAKRQWKLFIFFPQIAAPITFTCHPCGKFLRKWKKKKMKWKCSCNFTQERYVCIQTSFIPVRDPYQYQSFGIKLNQLQGIGTRPNDIRIGLEISIISFRGLRIGPTGNFDTL